MAPFKNAMEVFKLLDKSNCRACHEKTCLAFAGAVFTGKRQLLECPRLDPGIIEKYGGQTGSKISFEDDLDRSLATLKKKARAMDLSSAAKRLGVEWHKNTVTIKILGKDFSIRSDGTLSSDIHVHPWVAIPALQYVLQGGGTPVSGKWVPFRELRNGRTWHRLFEQRCEKPMKHLADTYTDLFQDMLDIFNGTQAANQYDSDISLVLHPLPRVPVLICYWKPEDGLGSSLNVFFDMTAEENLPIGALYILGTGLTRMFEKIAQRHGVRSPP